MSAARELWKRIETLHAVTYFAAESIDAAQEAGLRGFWMGYFGCRAAPLGPVGAPVVEATFANFAPAMVRRAIPDAWSFADPASLLECRSAAAATALRRVCPSIDGLAVEVGDRLRRAIDSADTIGRPMFAANRDVCDYDDPVAQLWQHCTTLREHRGDGHVLALAAAGIDGCEAHQLLIAEHGFPTETFRDHRGWTHDQWDAATERLFERGLLDRDGLSATGRVVRHDVETLTDRLATEPLLRAWGRGGTEATIRVLTDIATTVAGSGVLPYPNPMGLPSIAARDGVSPEGA